MRRRPNSPALYCTTLDTLTHRYTDTPWVVRRLTSTKLALSVNLRLEIRCLKLGKLTNIVRWVPGPGRLPILRDTERLADSPAFVI